MLYDRQWSPMPWWVLVLVTTAASDMSTEWVYEDDDICGKLHMNWIGLFQPHMQQYDLNLQYLLATQTYKYQQYMWQSMY